MFDIKSYLDHKGVDYSSFGENVTRGWINLQCLFCEDHLNHLGINLDGEYFHCWICGKAGPIYMIVQELEGGCSIAEANTIIARWQVEDMEKERIHIPPSGDILPKECWLYFPYPHIRYLNSRGFDYKELERKYSIKAVWPTGDWKFRIIAPIFLNGQVVNFIGLDITGEAKSKYKFCPNEKAIIPVRHLLYNIDSVQDNVIIVEGITDVWRVGDGAVATFGVEYTQEQIDLLRTKNLKRAAVVFDGEEMAIRKAHKLARNLYFVPHVEVIELEDGKDPDKLDEEGLRELRNWLKGG